ncbi:MAG: multicopper oxidase domain-containing protein [Cyanobacteria bacterium J06635_10]
MKVLRNFDYGTIKQANGRKIREFRITATNKIIDLNSAVSFNVWTYNGQVPGPTLRTKVGDKPGQGHAKSDRVRIIFLNRGGHSHSMHFHGTHPASSD